MSTGLINDNAINDALQRAKELAATPASTLKRPISPDSDSPSTKKANMDGSMSSIGTLGGMSFNGNGMSNPNENVVEVIAVPENSVGLVIGKGGSEISQIQAQSGARVQMAPETQGDGQRQCTLQGTKYAVERAKQLIHEVISRAQMRRQNGGGGGGGHMDLPPGGNAVTYDMLIPGTKCGLVIGKAGETIRQLQEQAGIKMMMVQDNTEASGQPKPLRMTGDPQKIEFAKQLVQDLLNSRNDEGGMSGGGGMMGGGGGGGMGMGGGGGGQAKGEVVVPRASVGMIIGKGGETIKRLAMETGTKIQFKPDDPSASDRCAVITGTRDQIYKATELITELVQKSCAQQGPQDTFYMHVPANKTGLVIGKGGDTIKQICNESGAHCELSRDPPPNASEKVFIIKGTAYQIHHAQHIIRIKVGDIAPGTPVPPFAGAGAPAMSAFGSAQAAPFNGGGFQMQQQQQQQWNNGFAQPDQSNAWGAQPIQQQQQQFYQQPQQQQFAMQQQPAAAAYQQPAAAGYAQPAAAAQPVAAAQPAQAAGTPAINAATGQADYSAQWAEYYRSLGLHDQAAKIEAQMRGGGGAAAPQQPAQPQPAQGQWPAQFVNQQPQAF